MKRDLYLNFSFSYFSCDSEPMNIFIFPLQLPRFSVDLYIYIYLKIYYQMIFFISFVKKNLGNKVYKKNTWTKPQ